MRRLFLCAGLSMIGTGPILAQDLVEVVTASSLAWADAPSSLPEGAKIAVLSGAPSREGPFVVRLRLPADYKIPAHHYSTAELVTVLAGAFHIGTGDKLDTAKGRVLVAGDFVEVPARTSHYAWTTEPAVIEIYGQGRSEMTYIDPMDDPRRP